MGLNQGDGPSIVRQMGNGLSIGSVVHKTWNAFDQILTAELPANAIQEEGTTINKVLWPATAKLQQREALLE